MRSKRTYYNYLFSIIITVLFCVSVQGGQESHGGDSLALEFVKIGRALDSLLGAHRDWEVTQALPSKTLIQVIKNSSETLPQAISNSFISVGQTTVTGMPDMMNGKVPEITFLPSQLDAYDKKGNIFIHGPEWENLIVQKKLKKCFIFISHNQKR